jgi:Mrp family chromosome partitioning ATPase
MSVEKIFPVGLINHEIERPASSVAQIARPAVDSPDSVDIPSFTLSAAGRATVARLYGSLRDSEQIIAVVGWDKSDRSGELALQLGLGLTSLTEEPVLLADVAEGKPHLHDLLNTSATPGIAEILDDASTAAGAIRPTSVKNFFFLPCGAPSNARTNAFSLRAWDQVITPLRKYRRIVLHLGPLPDSARSTVIASQSDAAVLAVGAGVRRNHEVMDLRRKIEALHVRLAGAVLTTNG